MTAKERALATAMPVELNQKLLREWINALRSGEFHQGEGGLRRQVHDTGTTEFCCLGVFAECMVRMNMCAEARTANLGAEATSYAYDGKMGVLSTYLLNELLPAVMGDRNLIAFNHQMYMLNDNYHCTFSEIADYLERHYVRKEV